MAIIHDFGVLAFSGLATGKSRPIGMAACSVAALPTDPVGTTTVAFSGVTVGSEIHVYLPDGTELTGTESCTANQQLTWQVYAPGSPNNTVSITLIKRGIRPQKFEYLSSVGNKTIPLFPQPDLGYNNPA